MNYEYKATNPSLPPDATSPVMDSAQMTQWLNEMASEGWEFVGYGQKWWHDQDIPQGWWIFRRLKKMRECWATKERSKSL